MTGLVQWLCLDRKAKGERFSTNSVHDIDQTMGIFEVEKEAGSKKKEDAHARTGKDFTYHVSIFLAVFQHRQEWQ